MTIEELKENVENYEVYESNGMLYEYGRLQDMVYEYNDPCLNGIVNDVYEYGELLFLFMNMAREDGSKAVWNIWKLLDEGCNPYGYFYTDEYGDVKSIDREYLYKLKERLLEAIEEGGER